MKRAFILLLALTLLLASCVKTEPLNTSSEFTENAGVKVLANDTEYTVNFINDAKGIFLLDRNYRVDNTLHTAFKAPSDGTAVLYYLTGEADECVCRAVKSGERVAIPTNGAAVFLPGVTAEAAEVQGYTLDRDGYIDLSGSACVTTEDGLCGFILSHKDVASIEAGMTNLLIQPTTTLSLDIPDGYEGVFVKRAVYGSFEALSFDEKAASRKYFTLILSDEYAKAFASDIMKEDGKFLLTNTELITKYGTSGAVEIGEFGFETQLNPAEVGDGVFVYDENSNLTLSPERDGAFVDVLVFDGVVAQISEKSARTIFPYPNGYMVCFNGDAACEKASKIQVGDRVTTVALKPETSPSAYVSIGKGKIEVAYRNEYRSAVAYAVLYDGEHLHNSTDTSIWGMEAAVDADGNIVKIVKSSVEGTSGNTEIPEGGFVISTGDEKYMTYLKSAKVGDKAEYVRKDGMYFFREVRSALYDSYGEGEYLSVITYGFSKTTRPISGASVILADKNGVVTAIASGEKSASIPEDGFALVSTGVKKTELLRFIKTGRTVILSRKYEKLYIYGSAEASIESCSSLLAEIKATRDEAAKQFINLDYAAIDSAIADASAKLKAAYENPEGAVDALASIEMLQTLIAPSFAVQDRAAWLVDYDSDLADVKKTVSYAVRLGLNTLIVSPFRDCYTLYDTSVPHLAKHPDLDSETDLLKMYVDECHKANLKIYFMYCCFSSACPGSDYADDYYVNYFADKLLLSKAGRNAAYFYEDASYTLNPYDEEVRQWALSILREVAENYDVDGIQLDYVRFPQPTYYGDANYEDHGYNADIVSAFQKWAGTSVDPATMTRSDRLWSKWCEFRSSIITSFVREASQLMSEHGLIFSCTCFAGQTERREYVFQDVATWAAEGYIDELYPMIYSATLEGQAEHGDILKAEIGNACRIILGIGTYDGETADVITQQVYYSYLLGTDGNSVFAFNYIPVFGFDKLYADSLYRVAAVRTDEYEKTVYAAADELLQVVTKVYEYLDADGDYGDLKEKISEFKAKFEVRSGDKAQYCADVIEGLKELSKGANEDFKKRVELYVDMMTRVRNTI